MQRIQGNLFEKQSRKRIEANAGGNTAKISSIFLQNKKICIHLHPRVRQTVVKGEHSSVGLEHLPYKQRVMGSNPFAPTKLRDLGNW